jgi:hypothetical protein
VCLATSLLLSAIYPRCIDGVSLQSQELKQYSPFGICTSEFILLAFSRYTLKCRTTYIPRSGLCWTRFAQLPRHDLYFGLGCAHFAMAVSTRIQDNVDRNGPEVSAMGCSSVEALTSRIKRQQGTQACQDCRRRKIKVCLWPNIHIKASLLSR